MIGVASNTSCGRMILLWLSISPYKPASTSPHCVVAEDKRPEERAMESAQPTTKSSSFTLVTLQLFNIFTPSILRCVSHCLRNDDIVSLTWPFN